MAIFLFWLEWNGRVYGPSPLSISAATFGRPGQGCHGLGGVLLYCLPTVFIIKYRLHCKLSRTKGGHHICNSFMRDHSNQNEQCHQLCLLGTDYVAISRWLGWWNHLLLSTRYLHKRCRWLYRSWANNSYPC